MIKICISVTSHALDPLPLSQTVTPSRTPSPLERDVLYGRPLNPYPCFVMLWLFVKRLEQVDHRRLFIGAPQCDRLVKMKVFNCEGTQMISSVAPHSGEQEECH